MIKLIDINTNCKDYGYVEALLTDAFPADERRDASEQRLYTDSKHIFHCCLILDDDERVGLLTYWDFGEFCYIEHFAISEEFRNKRLGEKALRMLMDNINRPIVLEVERPEDEMSRRRIAFYQRQGLRLWECDYYQPPYRKGGNRVPMRLMASPALDHNTDYQNIVTKIHNQVYNA